MQFLPHWAGCSQVGSCSTPDLQEKKLIIEVSYSLAEGTTGSWSQIYVCMDEMKGWLSFTFRTQFLGK